MGHIAAGIHRFEDTITVIEPLLLDGCSMDWGRQAGPRKIRLRRRIPGLRHVQFACVRSRQ